MSNESFDIRLYKNLNIISNLLYTNDPVWVKAKLWLHLYHFHFTYISYHIISITYINAYLITLFLISLNFFFRLFLSCNEIKHTFFWHPRVQRSEWVNEKYVFLVQRDFFPFTVHTLIQAAIARNLIAIRSVFGDE